ncbi:MAG TPA: PH domain-containing protein [Pirellulaceae bacterium]|nr:PH domain-containing protein [Pirellulaceae bacterium]
MSNAQHEGQSPTIQPVNPPSVPETDLWQGRYSGKAMYGSWLMAGVVTFAALLAWFLWPFARDHGLVRWALVLGVLAWWIGLALLYAYHRCVHYYELTSLRLKHREGILVQTMNRIELVDIEDISYRQGIIQRMLGVGNITIKSKDVSHPLLLMHGIDQVRQVTDIIDNARLAERRRRALHIQSL